MVRTVHVLNYLNKLCFYYFYYVCCIKFNQGINNTTPMNILLYCLYNLYISCIINMYLLPKLCIIDALIEFNNIIKKKCSMGVVFVSICQ